MLLDQSHLSCFTLLLCIIWFHTGCLIFLLSCIISQISRYVYKVHKFCNLTSFIRLRRKIKNINNMFKKIIMLTDNNKIFRNWFVIIHHHLTKVSAQIIQFIIFERNELSITLSTLWFNGRGCVIREEEELKFTILCWCVATR